MPSARTSRRSPAVPARHVALLRALNVGGANRLDMASLRAHFEAAGASAVRTYIQSGNVVFEASAGRAAQVTARVRARLASAHGLEVPIVLRSARELEAVVRGNPFLAAGADPARLHLAFLAGRPAAAAVAALDPARSPPDAFEVRGREVYLHLPNGAARTRLSTAWLDSRLGTVSTLRSWRTVERLLAMATA
jgi:uncharacterized protein (DUF1697 family)